MKSLMKKEKNNTTFKGVYRYGLIAAFIFLLNFIWEISQAFLYEVHFQGRLDFILVHLKAASGDLLIFLLLYFFGVLFFHRDCYWLIRNNKVKFMFVSFLGIVVSVVIEKLALSFGRWSYNSLMPIVPVLNVGLTPVLQMIILPVVSIVFAKRVIDNNSQ
jgi:hypothetical protein